MTVATPTRKRKTPSASNARRLRKLAEANGWDIAPLAREAAGLDDRELARVLMVLKSGMVVVDAKRASMRALISRVPWSGASEFRGLPMWAWRTVLETEASLRPSFTSLLTLTAKEPSMEKENAPARGARNLESAPPGPGRTAREVTDPKEIRKIWASCRKFGGKLSFEQAEHVHGLRSQKGMTAWRVCDKHEKRRKKR